MSFAQMRWVRNGIRIFHSLWDLITFFVRVFCNENFHSVLHT